MVTNDAAVRVGSVPAVNAAFGSMWIFAVGSVLGRRGGRASSAIWVVTQEIRI
jgi:hypothetical protein